MGRGEDKGTPILGDGLMHTKRSHGAVASQGADILGESDNCLTPPPMGDDTPGETESADMRKFVGGRYFQVVPQISSSLHVRHIFRY